MSQDWVDVTVKEIWIKQPGIGIEQLRQQVVKLASAEACIDNDDGNSNVFVSVDLPPSPSDITKARIKQAKSWIPYRYIPNHEFEIEDPAQEALIRQRMEERLALRATNQYEKADDIQRALAAMGVSIDDHKKSWSLSKSIPRQFLVHSAVDKESKKQPILLGNSRSTCKFCGKTFPSRNHVFRHLRDPTSGCGTAVFATGQEIPTPPSEEAKRERQARQIRTRSNARPASHAHAEQSLWVGDIPFPWTAPQRQYKYLRALLFQYVPRTVPRPWIKRVVRKSYRKVVGDETKGPRAHHGYAIVVFRDEQEANLCLSVLHKQRVDPQKVFSSQTLLPSTEHDVLQPFVLKVSRSEKGDSVQAAWNCIRKETPEQRRSGDDPPLFDQLAPLDIGEIRRRIESLGGSCETFQISGDSAIGPSETERMILHLCSLYQEHKGIHRRAVRRKGRLIPASLQNKLLSELESLRWPARNERSDLAAERYLVLQTNLTNDRFFGGLRAACQELMDWVDKGYYYSGIAVTKNFVGSPHIDFRDQTFQYAVCLGNFRVSASSGGGELCVEGQDDEGELINVIECHNRIARVDGRCVHWVRNWESGDRYSLIFYNTSDKNVSPLLKIGVDEDYLNKI